MSNRDMTEMPGATLILSPSVPAELIMTCIASCTVPKVLTTAEASTKPVGASSVALSVSRLTDASVRL